MSSSKSSYKEEVDVSPLVDAFMKTSNVEEKKIINKLIEGLLCGQPFPKQFFESQSCPKMLSLGSRRALELVIYGHVAIEKEEMEVRVSPAPTSSKKEVRFSGPIIKDEQGWVSPRVGDRRELVCALSMDPKFVDMQKRSLSKTKNPFTPVKRAPIRTKRPILANTEDDDEDVEVMEVVPDAGPSSEPELIILDWYNAP